MPFDMATSKSEKSKPGLMAVRWDRPGSIYHGQVHRVSEVLVDYLSCGQVDVWAEGYSEDPPPLCLNGCLI